MAKNIIEFMAEMHFDKYSGTVHESNDFNVEKDCESLNKAMKGLGTDEKAIINIVAKRSLKQRLVIAQRYKELYKKELKSELKSELSGNFRELVLALFIPQLLFDAKCLRKAVKGIGTDETALIEIFASRTNDQIKAIKKIYKEEYKHDLEKDVIGDTSGDFKNILISLIKAARDESHDVNEDLAKSDAASLFTAGEKKSGTDENVFIKIFCSRSFPQLRATFREYRKILDKDITESIKSETSGDFRSTLLAIVQNARCPPAFFSRLLYHSMKGAGTKEKQLTRVVVTRCEIDMVQIKEAFQTMFKTTLEKFIKGDTSGDYEKLLLALVS